MADEDLDMYRRLIAERDAALAWAHDALRGSASALERIKVRAEIERILPQLQS